MKINVARLNHILLPDTKAGRDRFRAGFWGKALAPVTWFYESLSDEGRVLAVASLVVGFFGLDVQGTEVHLLWAAIVGLFVGALLVRRAYRLDGVLVTVLAPRRVTLGDELRFAVVLRNDGPRDAFAVRIRGPFLPWDGRWSGRAPGLRALRAGTEERVEIAARFIARGEHHLDAFGAAALVPLGLTLGKPVWSGGTKFLVLPKIANVVRMTTALGRRHQPGGVALASRTGESMDLLGVRPYRPGDPVKNLHARTWARTGIPAVREYQEEYFSRVGVVVDTSAPTEPALEAAISLAAGVVACLGRGEALIDLLVVGSDVHDLTIGRHLGFLDQALDLLACITPAKSPLDPDHLLARLTPHLSRLSCLIVITTAWDPKLSERIGGHGVACTTLVVTSEAAPPRHPPHAGEAHGASGARGAAVTTLSVAAIERGEALSL